MAADKTGAAGNENVFPRIMRADRHERQCGRSTQRSTSRVRRFRFDLPGFFPAVRAFAGLRLIRTIIAWSGTELAGLAPEQHPVVRRLRALAKRREPRRVQPKNCLGYRLGDLP